MNMHVNYHIINTMCSDPATAGMAQLRSAQDDERALHVQRAYTVHHKLNTRRGSIHTFPLDKPWISMLI